MGLYAKKTRGETTHQPGLVALAGMVLLALSVMGGCVSPLPRSPVAKLAGGERGGERRRIVEVIHRHARLQNGDLAESAINALADRAIQGLTGEAFPLDGWAALIPAEGPLTVLASPERGRLAEAVVRRLRLAAGREGAVVVARDDENPGSGPVLWVVESGWRDPGLTLDPAQAARTRFPGIHFAGVLADLLEPRVNGEPWKADAVLAAEDPDGAALALRHVLGARRRGEMGDPAREAAGLKLDPRSIEWVSDVINR